MKWKAKPRFAGRDPHSSMPDTTATGFRMSTTGSVVSFEYASLIYESRMRGGQNGMFQLGFAKEEKTSANGHGTEKPPRRLPRRLGFDDHVFEMGVDR